MHSSVCVCVCMRAALESPIVFRSCFDNDRQPTLQRTFSGVEPTPSKGGFRSRKGKRRAIMQPPSSRSAPQEAVSSKQETQPWLKFLSTPFRKAVNAVNALFAGKPVVILQPKNGMRIYFFLRLFIFFLLRLFLFLFCCPTSYRCISHPI